MGGVAIDITRPLCTVPEMGTPRINRTFDEFRARLRETPSGCWEWTRTLNNQGYGVTWLNGRRTSAHRAAWVLAHGPIPAGRWVLHSCDNPPCCNPDHLWLGTPRDNQRDCISKGRKAFAVGSAASMAKLTEGQIPEVRARCASGETQTAVARDLGVTRGTIYKILHRECWGQVP